MVKATMSTVDKALALLRHFSVQHREIGLSELARMARHDKTTTLRCLTALERHGFVEQDTITRRYRLGLAPINLARVREQSFPVQSVIKPHLARLTEVTGETAHATLVAGAELLTVMIREPERALRVHVDPATPLPVHATASGIAIAAFLPNEALDTLLQTTRFERFTKSTPTSRTALNKAFVTARKAGIASSLETFEDDVTGTAAPIFAPSGFAMGAIAVAAVSHRLTRSLERRIEIAVLGAAEEITQALGGLSPAPGPTRQKENAS